MKHSTLAFRVIARSANTNSFGLRGHVLVARNRRAFEVGRADFSGNAPWTVNTEVPVPVLTTDEGKVVSYTWAQAGCEIPRELARPSVAVMRSVFGPSWRASRKYAQA